MNQIYMFTGVRGSGKTVFLTETANRFRERDDWIVIDLNAQRDLLDSLAAKLASHQVLSQWFREAEINLQAFGVNVGLKRSTAANDIEDILIRMLRSIQKHRLRVLVTIDEATNSREIRAFASAYQIFIREGLPVFLLVAAPWFILMQREHQDFLRYFFLNENLLRFLVRDYGDRYGAGRETFRGMAAVWTFVVALPWAILPVHDVLKRRWGLFDRRNFFFVSMLSITAFWCLTSRVPIAYLLPIVPLFAAWIASSRSAHLRLWRMLPFAAIAASVLTGAVMLYTWVLTDKMLGTEAPRRISKRCFAYEFYHGPWGEGAPK